MAFKWMDGGENINSIPARHKKFFENGKSKLTEDELEAISKYVEDSIDKYINNSIKENPCFTVAWIFPHPWEYPLDLIWSKACDKDEKNSAFWLGLLVMDVIINKNEEWLADKTNFNRDFDQIAYWKSAD